MEAEKETFGEERAVLSAVQACPSLARQWPESTNPIHVCGCCCLLVHLTCAVLWRVSAWLLWPARSSWQVPASKAAFFPEIKLGPP